MPNVELTVVSVSPDTLTATDAAVSHGAVALLTTHTVTVADGTESSVVVIYREIELSSLEMAPTVFWV